MAEKLVTGEPGSRWVPHPAFRHRLYPKCTPPQPSCPKERRGRRPRPPAPGSTSRPAPLPDRPRLPPHPGAGNAAAGARGPVKAAPLVAASLPHPNRPRPSPQGPARGRAAATGLHNPAGDGGRGGHGPGATAPPQCGGARRPRVGIPSPPAPPRRAPSTPFPLRSWAGVGDRNRLPTWRTGSGPARRREHSSRAGSGGSGPGAPASRGAVRVDCGVRCPRGASRGANDSRGEGSRPPPQTGTPRPQVGLGWRVREDTSSILPTYPRLAACKRVSRHHPSRDSLGLLELHPEGFWWGELWSPQLRATRLRFLWGLRKVNGKGIVRLDF